MHGHIQKEWRTNVDNLVKIDRKCEYPNRKGRRETTESKIGTKFLPSQSKSTRSTLTLQLGLEAGGFDVDTFNDSKVALSSFKPSLYDLVLIDIMMPIIGSIRKYMEIDHSVIPCQYYFVRNAESLFISTHTPIGILMRLASNVIKVILQIVFIGLSLQS
jgi:CheY-like chemotaxis protein